MTLAPLDRAQLHLAFEDASKAASLEAVAFRWMRRICLSHRTKLRWIPAYAIL